MPDLPHSHDRRQFREPETGVNAVLACTLTRHPTGRPCVPSGATSAWGQVVNDGHVFSREADHAVDGQLM